MTPPKSPNYPTMNSIGLVPASHQLTQDSSMTIDSGTLEIHLCAPKHLHHLCTSNSQGF